MRKIRFILLVMLLLPGVLSGQSRLRERVYVSTDREVYVAGDAVWMSAYCVDASSGKLSSFSKTAYVEIHSSAGMVQTAKIALEGGRGGGRLMLPNTLPTGNYRLLAYTALGASEEGFDPSVGARTLSVFNTFSNERIEGGVKVVGQAQAAAALRQAGGLTVSAAAGDAGTARIMVTNNGPEAVSFNLGVRHEDGIPAPAGGHIADFVGSLHSLPAARGFDASVVPEYEGEIIRARVTGTDAEGLESVKDKYAFISSPGDGQNIYTALIRADGSATFFTSNIYGDQNMFLEIEDVNRDNICHLEIISPFLNLEPGDIPELALSPEYSEALELRGVAMQLERNFNSDTLYSALPARQHKVLDPQSCKSYILDDYTRFPVMEDIFIEFIPEIRVRQANGKRELQLLVTDQRGQFRLQQGMSLVLLDGVPVLDQEKIFSYDPLLVKRIDIYPDSYFVGIRGFSGIVNFVTYKGTLPSMAFEDNVRIVDFQGTSYPLAYTCEGVSNEYPDFRQTLLWHPLLSLEPGESMEMECKMPVYTGRFEAVAEGITSSGSAVMANSTFTIR
ncbi:MAG: hypothetical protein J5577_00575 [Bacteroidales bacterium]|nr:hypothetical protein [Bacteroidales bacterium]